jgi:hypothetical protein
LIVSASGAIVPKRTGSRSNSFMISSSTSVRAIMFRRLFSYSILGELLTIAPIRR